MKKAIATALSVLGLGLSACTTTGTGVGVAADTNTTATFTWTAGGPRTGTMTAALSSGQTYAGPFFQITRETTVDELGPLWVGWRGRYRWHGWDDWGPTESTLTHYSGRVLANLAGPDGQMRCHFQLIRPTSGMAGGGQGRCQLPSGTMIDATFPPT